MSNFKFSETEIKGVYIIEPKVFGDSRGYFLETYSERDFFAAGLTMKFVQDNQSKSTKGVLRGLHFQTQHPQVYMRSKKIIFYFFFCNCDLNCILFINNYNV